MTKLKVLAMTALMAGMFATGASAMEIHAKSHPGTTMQKEYGFEKDGKTMKMHKKKHHHHKAAMKKEEPKKEEAKKPMHHKHHKMHKKAMTSSHGNFPNECTNPPCGYNYNR